MPSNKIHIAHQMDGRPDVATCSWSDNFNLTLTTRPEEVTCKNCFKAMAGGFRRVGKYKEFFEANPQLRIKYVD
jgi:hypothetical protein